LVRAPLPISLIVEEDNRELPRLFKNNHKEEEGKEEPSQNDPTRALIIGSWGMAIFTQFIFAIRPFYLTQGFFLAFYCAQLVIMMIAVFYESNSRRINSLLIAGRCAAVIAMLCIALQITFGGEKYVWIAVLAYFFAQVCNAPFGYLVHEKAVNKIASQNLRERQFLYAGLIVNVLFSLFFPDSPYFVWGLVLMTLTSLGYLLVRRREHML
jgi:heme exporter protein D